MHYATSPCDAGFYCNVVARFGGVADRVAPRRFDSRGVCAARCEEARRRGDRLFAEAKLRRYGHDETVARWLACGVEAADRSLEQRLARSETVEENSALSGATSGLLGELEKHCRDDSQSDAARSLCGNDADRRRPPRGDGCRLQLVRQRRTRVQRESGRDTIAARHTDSRFVPHRTRWRPREIVEQRRRALHAGGVRTSGGCRRG